MTYWTSPITPTILINSDGTEYAITPGVVDESAILVYQTGHSLAFAAAVSREHGCGIVVQIQEPPFSDRVFVRAWATLDPSYWIEISGAQIPAMVEALLDPDEVFEFIAPEDVAATLDEWAPTLPPQRPDLADQMVSAVIRPQEPTS